MVEAFFVKTFHRTRINFQFCSSGESETEGNVGLARAPSSLGMFVWQCGDESADHLFELFVAAEEFHVIGDALVEVIECGEDEDGAGIGELGLVVAFFS